MVLYPHLRDNTGGDGREIEVSCTVLQESVDFLYVSVHSGTGLCACV